jgi:hypothetical protein
VPFCQYRLPEDEHHLPMTGHRRLYCVLQRRELIVSLE